jgi:hypothetical protein
MTGTMRALALPRPVSVRCGPDGRPSALGDDAVEAVREEWRVEESWWSDQPLRRRYFELVLTSGRLAVVFEDLRPPRRWYAQGS